MPLSLFLRRFALPAATIVPCFCLALIAGPLQAAPARDWPYYSPADMGKSANKNADKNADETIRAAQYLLRARGYPVAADGLFGKNTVAAVRRFQRSHHLIADGTLRPPTWEALVIRLAPGASGPAVNAAQVQLRMAGYAVPVDGRFSPQMKAIVRKFQAQTGHSADGVIGLNTWSELMYSHDQGD